MTDRPILFSAPMVRALLDGRKTQTRRVLRDQPRIRPELHEDFLSGGAFWCVFDGDEIAHEIGVPYRIGDRLWVREAFSYEAFDADRNGFMPPWYWADGKPTSGVFTRTKSSIHMPRWASRLTLTVTDVRVQRLQQISEADALAEGIEPYGGIDPDCGGWRDYSPSAPRGRWIGAIDSYRTLWDSLHGPEAWDANPWIVALTFDVARENIGPKGGAV